MGYLAPMLLKWLIAWVEDAEAPRGRGYLIAVVLVVVLLFQVCRRGVGDEGKGGCCDGRLRDSFPYVLLFSIANCLFMWRSRNWAGLVVFPSLHPHPSPKSPFAPHPLPITSVPAACAVQTVMINQYFNAVYRVGMHIRSACVAAIYRKSLRLSPAARATRDVGKIGARPSLCVRGARL